MLRQCKLRKSYLRTNHLYEIANFAFRDFKREFQPRQDIHAEAEFVLRYLPSMNLVAVHNDSEADRGNYCAQVCGLPHGKPQAVGDDSRGAFVKAVSVVFYEDGALLAAVVGAL